MKIYLIIFSLFLSQILYAQNLNTFYGVDVECLTRIMNKTQDCEELEGLAMERALRVGGENSPVKAIHLTSYNSEVDTLGVVRADPRSEDFEVFLRSQSSNRTLVEYLPVIQDMNDILSKIYGKKTQCSFLENAQDCKQLQAKALENAVFVGNSTRIKKIVLGSFSTRYGNSLDIFGGLQVNPNSEDYKEFLESEK